MMRHLKTSLAAVLTAAAIASPALAQGDVPSGAAGMSKPAPPTGEAIYHQTCAACHMHDGKGATGAATIPSLAGDARLVAPQYPILVVLIGKGVMPGFAPYMTNDQMASVITYVRGNFGNKYPKPVTADDVAKIAAGNPQR